MTEFLIAVTAASQIYRSRANTIVLTAGQCTLLVVVSRPTVQKITTAFKTLYDMLEVRCGAGRMQPLSPTTTLAQAQGRYNHDDYLFSVTRFDKDKALAHLRACGAPSLIPEAQKKWDEVPAQAAIFYL